MSFYTLIRTIVMCWLAMWLMGCVAIDSRAWKEPIAMDAPQSITGRYSNKANYKSSKMGFTGSSHFSHLTGYHNNSLPDSFLLRVTDSNEITVEYFLESLKLGQQTFNNDRGLTIHRNYSIDLFSYSTCGGGGESLQLGCMSKTVKLFVNPEGNLVTVQSGGGAGLVTILPFAIYGKLVAIYPRIEE